MNMNSSFCPADHKHGALIYSYTNKVYYLKEHGIKLIFTIPALVCEKCRKNGREVSVDLPDVKERVESKLLVYFTDFVKRNSKNIPFKVDDINISFTTLEIKEKAENESEDMKFNPERFNFLAVEPKRSLENIVLSKKIKKAICETLDNSKLRELLINNWKINADLLLSSGTSILLSGPPGTGKTVTAEAISNELKKKFLPVNYAHLESKYVGEMNKNIVSIFELAKAKDAVLFFDEADSVLGRRLTSVTQSSDHGVNMSRSVLLTEMEKHAGVVIFSTNLAKNIDEAFRRRIFSYIEFELPGYDERKALWGLYLPSSVPKSVEITLDFCAKHSEGLTGADIQKAAVKSMFSLARRFNMSENTAILLIEDIFESIEEVRLSYQVVQSMFFQDNNIPSPEVLENMELSKN